MKAVGVVAVAFVAVVALVVAAPLAMALHDEAAATPVFNHGVDVSTLVSVSAFKCMRVANPVVSHVIVRAFRSTGSSDPNVVQTLKNAIAAGFDASNLGVYIFPRPLTSAGQMQDGAVQVRNMMNNLINNGAGDLFRSVWFDFEGGDLYWSTSTAKNVKFVEEMLTEGKKYQPKYQLGIYTSKSQWAPIVGNSYTGGKDFPLWYAAYNGKTDFSDFTPFAGWTTPTLHQYAGDKKVCGIPADLNTMTWGTLMQVAAKSKVNGGQGAPEVPIPNSPACAAARGMCTNIALHPCVGTVKKGVCPGPKEVVCCVNAPVLRSSPGAAGERPATTSKITAEAIDTGKVTWHRDRPRRGPVRRLQMGGLMRIRRRKHGKKKKGGKGGK